MHLACKLANLGTEAICIQAGSTGILFQLVFDVNLIHERLDSLLEFWLDWFAPVFFNYFFFHKCYGLGLSIFVANDFFFILIFFDTFYSILAFLIWYAERFICSKTGKNGVICLVLVQVQCGDFEIGINENVCINTDFCLWCKHFALEKNASL